MLQFFKGNKTDLSHHMWREIGKITGPAFVEIVMSTLFGMVDMIMVGQLGSAAIAAVGLTNQPFMLLLAIFAAVNVGATTLVAWNIGAGNKDKASAVTRQTLLVNTGLGLVLSVVGFIFAHEIVLFMGAEADTVRDATIYFQIVASGLVFQAITMAITASLRGAGETRLPMIYNIGSNLINVFGNYVLIYGALGFPKMGVTGAAVSTTFSRILACAFGLYILYSRKSVISISQKENYKLDFEIIRKVFSIGIPSALEQFVIQGGLIMYARIVSGLGTQGFAAHQIGLNISGLTFAPSMAFGVAATTLVGQSLGADDEEKAKKYADVIHYISLVVAFLMGFVFILFSHELAGLYTTELEVAAMAGTVLKILALAQPGQSTQLTLAGALRGAGDTMYPLYASIFGIWGFRVVLAYIFVNLMGWGLVGAWAALAIDQYMRGAVVFFRYRSGKWKYIKSRTEEVSELDPAEAS